MVSADADTPGPPLKRQKKMENVSLQELPADEFMNKIKLFSGPQVTVCVGGKEFELSKALLCYYSPYFERALNGNFKEGMGVNSFSTSHYAKEFQTEQKVTLEGHSAESFQLVIQWIYQSKIVLPQAHGEASARSSPFSVAASDNENGVVKPSIEGDKKILRQQMDHVATHPIQTLGSLNISLYLDFLTLADYIELLGPFEPVDRAITDIISRTRLALTHDHVRAAMVFPVKHPTRQLLVQATVREYIDYLIQGKGFRFEKQLEEMDGFASDLLRACTKTFAQRVTGTKNVNDKMKTYVFDPLGGGKILITAVPKS